jgi:4'-phosphopantetheinyl transferase EntD
MPVWPKGVVGSLSHDAEVAVAAIASSRNFSAIGIDVEPAEPLKAELLDMVATPNERQATGRDLNLGRLLFCIKEAVYKAVYPLDRVFLEHHDVEVSLAENVAVVRAVRSVDFRFFQASHIVVLAYLRALPGAF